MATNDSTGPTVTMTLQAYDAVTLRLEQIGAMISAFGIGVSDTEEIPVSNRLLAVSLEGYATFISDIRDMLIDEAKIGGAA